MTFGMSSQQDKKGKKKLLIFFMKKKKSYQVHAKRRIKKQINKKQK